jgi:hypothetical protein
MPKSRKIKPKIYPKKQIKKTPVQPVNITKSKFYWIALSIVTVVCILILGVATNIPIQKVALIMTTVLSVLGLAGYIRVKPSNLTIKSRATYLFVGAAVIGYGIWAVMVILLAVTGLGVQVANPLGDQLFIVSTQIIFIVMGAFIGDMLSKNMTFLSFAGKIKEKLPQ